MPINLIFTAQPEARMVKANWVLDNASPNFEPYDRLHIKRLKHRQNREKQIADWETKSYQKPKRVEAFVWHSRVCCTIVCGSEITQVLNCGGVELMNGSLAEPRALLGWEPSRELEFIEIDWLQHQLWHFEFVTIRVSLSPDTSLLLSFLEEALVEKLWLPLQLSLTTCITMWSRVIIHP